MYHEKIVMLEAVRKNGRLLEYASDELKNDEEVVHASLNNCALSCRFASPEIKNTKQVVLMVVKRYPGLIQYASNELRHDHEVCLEATRHSIWAFQHIPDELRPDILSHMVKRIEYKDLFRRTLFTIRCYSIFSQLFRQNVSG